MFAFNKPGTSAPTKQVTSYQVKLYSYGKDLRRVPCPAAALTVELYEIIPPGRYP